MALQNICLPSLYFGNAEGLNHTLLQVFPHVCLYAQYKCGYSYIFVTEKVKSSVFLFSFKLLCSLVSIQSSGPALTEVGFLTKFLLHLFHHLLHHPGKPWCLPEADDCSPWSRREGGGGALWAEHVGGPRWREKELSKHNTHGWQWEGGNWPALPTLRCWLLQERVAALRGRLRGHAGQSWHRN